MQHMTEEKRNVIPIWDKTKDKAMMITVNQILVRLNHDSNVGKTENLPENLEGEIHDLTIKI